MTREEAINLLSQMRKDGEGFLSDNTIEAYDMAIKALEQEPFDIETYCKEHFCVMVDEDVWEKAEKALKQEPCEDAISRQAVMDCFKKWQPYMATRLWDFEQELSKLPSVNPTSNVSIQITEREKYGRFN